MIGQRSRDAEDRLYASSSRGGDVVARLEAVPPWRFAVIALGLFVIASLAIYWPQVPGSTHSLVGCACGDVMQEVWFLKWTPWAIVHGHNPLFTNWMDFPYGANLASNTVMPGLAILAAPWTWIWGPVSTYNLLMWVSFPLSGWSCFFVLRRLSNSNLAALLGGAVYGFSPYMFGQGYGHLFLIFAPLPPLIFYLVFRICVIQPGDPRQWGLCLGALVVGQFFISQEVAADVVIVGFLAVVILVVARRHDLTAARVHYAGVASLYALGLTVLILAYPVYFQIFGPQAVHGAAHGTIHSPLKLDVLGTVVPDRLQAIRPSWLTRVGDSFMGSDLAENGSYLGVPLVAALALIVWTLRRQRGVIYVAAVLLMVEVLSMGRWLMVANHTIHVPLPWTVLAKLPLLDAILPNRFSLFASFFVATLVALGVAHWVECGAHSRELPRREQRGAINAALCGLVVVSVAVYAPQLPVVTVALPTVPAFFTSSDARLVPEGSVVLPFPVSAAPYTASMYWQILTDFRWKMVSGEAIIPTSNGSVTGQPAADRPLAVTQFLSHYSGGLARLPAFNDKLKVRMREFIFLNHVGTVLLDPNATNASRVLPLFESALGPPQSEGAMDVWFHAQSLARRVQHPSVG